MRAMMDGEVDRSRKRDNKIVIYTGKIINIG